MSSKPKLCAGIASAVLAGCAAIPAAHADTQIAEGIAIFGTVDVGVAWQSAGVPLNGDSVGGLEYQAFTTTRNFNGSLTTFAENALEQSKIGLTVNEKLGDSGFAAVGKLETAFNPLSGKLSNACKSIADNSGVGTTASPQGQTANFDSSRCGQAINGVIYGGLASKAYGTLTVGRQLSLVQVALGAYDPQAVAPAFSFFGYSGYEAGGGSTQATRLDNSAQYSLAAHHVHATVLYGQGGRDTGVLGHSIMGDLGVAWHGLEVDGVFLKSDGVVNLRSAFNNAAAPLGGTPPTGLSAYVSDNTSWNLMAKYTIATHAKAKVVLYGGYTHLRKEHADTSGGAAQGGYPIAIAINLNSPITADVFWTGARYTTARNLSVSLGLYHIHQSATTIGHGASGTQGIGCASAGLLCAGNFDEASLVIDRPVVRHVDVYAGVNWSRVTNGLAWGFVDDQGGAGSGTQGSQTQVTLASGLRIKF